MEPEGSLPHSQVPVIRTNLLFYDEELLAPHPTPKLKDHPLSVVRDCLFNIFAATLHIESIPGHWGFFPGHQTVPSALGSTQPLKMSTRIFLGVKTAGA